MKKEIKEHIGIKHLKKAVADGKISRRQFLRDTTLLGLSATAAYTFLGMAPQVARAANIPKGGMIRIGAAVQPLDRPHNYEWTQPDLTINTIEYLTKTGTDNVTRGWLAESWEASEDLRTWTFHIRKDVTWRNGRAFTADDAIWNLRHILDPKTGASGVGVFKPYMLETYETDKKDDEGNFKKSYRLWDANAIEKLDDHTIRLNARIPQLAVPEHFFSWPVQMIDPDEGGEFGVGSNGTGAYELVEYAGREKAVFKAARPHWSGVGPYADTLVFVDLEDDREAYFGALASGQIDMVREVQIEAVDQIKNHPDLVFKATPSGQTGVARMRTTSKPFDDARVRRAMRLAIDTNKVAEIGYYGVGVAAEHHHVCEVHPEYAKLPFMTQDIPEAKRLLTDAGYPNGIEVQFDIMNVGYHVTMAQVMKEMWAKAGINVNLNVMPSSQYWGIWKTTPFGYTTWTMRPLGVQVLGLAYRSDVPWNESAYSNKEFDELLDKAESTFDVEERRAVMSKLEQILQEDGPIVQPFWRPGMVAHHKRVKGFSAHPAARTFASEIGIEDG